MTSNNSFLLKYKNMWGWVVFAVGLVFLISGTIMMLIDSGMNQNRDSTGKPALPQYSASFGTTSVVLVSIGSLMVTGGLVAEIVAATMRPSLGGRRR
jgi:hypothetical protein